MDENEEPIWEEIEKILGEFVPPKPKPTLTQLIRDWCDHEGFNYSIQWQNKDNMQMNGFGWNLNITKNKASLSGEEPINIADPVLFEELKNKIAEREKKALGKILDSID